MMTFNIRYDNEGDGKNQWKNRKDKVTPIKHLGTQDYSGHVSVRYWASRSSTPPEGSSTRKTQGVLHIYWDSKGSSEWRRVWYIFPELQIFPHRLRIRVVQLGKETRSLRLRCCLSSISDVCCVAGPAPARKEHLYQHSFGPPIQEVSVSRPPNNSGDD